MSSEACPRRRSRQHGDEPRARLRAHRRLRGRRPLLARDPHPRGARRARRRRRCSRRSTRRWRAVKPDVVSINTMPDTHADVRHQGDGGGRARVPREADRRDRRRRRARGRDRGRAPAASWSIGYILRHHPSWMRFVELARTLGTPLVFRMNLNQQSSGAQWETHKKLLAVAVADRRLRRALRRHLVPDHAGEARQRARRRRPAHRGSAAGDVQLRPPRSDVRRQVGRLVRGRLGADDERDRLLREGRDRAEGLGVDRARLRRRGA